MSAHLRLPQPAPSLPPSDNALPSLAPSAGEGRAAHSSTSDHHLDIQILDALSGAPLRTGGYIKSCTVTFARQSVHFYCPDRRRHPRADLARAAYVGHEAAAERQRKRFHRFVSAGLKLLGMWDAEVCENWSPALGKAIVNWHRPLLDEADQEALELRERRGLMEAVQFLVMEKGFAARLEESLAGWDRVDRAGHLRIALPICEAECAIKVRLELHDFKYLTEEDVDSAFTALQASPSHGLASHFHVAYERHGAPFDSRDPDHPRQESILPLSNWCLRANKDARIVRNFRNFTDFNLVVQPGAAGPLRCRIHALTYCQPSWYETTAYHRQETLTLEQCKTDKLVQKTTLPAISTTFADHGAFNYGGYGVLHDEARPGKLRRHTGIDIAGEEDKTPNFAIKGGRVYKATGRLVGIHHDDEQFTQYLHLHRRFTSRGQWVKAGSLIGMAGRRGIPEDLPTHTHLEVGIDEPSDGEARDGAPELAREPGPTLMSWVTAQFGSEAVASYRDFFPRNTPWWYVPPCKGEYRSLKDKPVHCTAGCLGEYDSLVAAQVRFAKDCFAIRTHRDPRLCACPGLSERGIESCFTLRQRIQHQLWVAGEYRGPFDGLLGSDVRAAILAAAPRLGAFHELLAQACRQGIATRQPKSKPWPPEPGHVLAELLRDGDNVRLLLSELERLNGSAHGLAAPQPVARHRRARSLRMDPTRFAGLPPALPLHARAGASPGRHDE